MARGNHERIQSVPRAVAVRTTDFRGCGADGLRRTDHGDPGGAPATHLASPASEVFIQLGNATSQARFGRPLVGKTENLVLSPVVIAMWKPMAEALGWGQKQLGWSDILTLSSSEEGWAKYGFPQWGRFKFGHTHPEYSNSGIISLIAEVYAAAGKQPRAVAGRSPTTGSGGILAQHREVRRSLRQFDGFLRRKMFSNGPEYLGAAVLYENMIIESGEAGSSLPFPVVAIYPKEGTFWSDHPVGIVDRDWVTSEHREAAVRYIGFLTAAAQQQRAIEFGFRPADPTLTLTSPLDLEHGVDPAEPQTTLEVPVAEVVQQIIELWKQQKKPARVTLVLDISGSMKGEKIDSAKNGALQLVDMLGVQDRLSILPFNDVVRWSNQDLPMRTDRETARTTIRSLFASGGTSAYDAVAEAHRQLMQTPDPASIAAIVVLSDGQDTNSALHTRDAAETDPYRQREPHRPGLHDRLR